MKFCHLIWFTEVLEWNHLGRYQLNGLFPLRDGLWKWNAYIFLTDFFWISLQGQWVSRCGGLHFLSTIQNTSYKISPGHSHVGFTVFTLLFQCLYWKSCSCCSLSCLMQLSWRRVIKNVTIFKRQMSCSGSYVAVANIYILMPTLKINY